MVDRAAPGGKLARIGKRFGLENPRAVLMNTKFRPGARPDLAPLWQRQGTDNCQTPVSLTLAQSEVPIPVTLRLFLPEIWTSDPD